MIEIMQEIIDEDLEAMREVLEEDLLPLIKQRKETEKKIGDKAIDEMYKLEGEL